MKTVFREKSLESQLHEPKKFLQIRGMLNMVLNLTNTQFTSKLTLLEAAY